MVTFELSVGSLYGRKMCVNFCVLLQLCGCIQIPKHNGSNKWTESGDALQPPLKRKGKEIPFHEADAALRARNFEVTSPTARERISRSCA